MAKGLGAGTYGAYTVANKNYKPIDYGQFAKGFADVAIAERKRKDETIDALGEKYGEMFNTDQMEGVGLDNFDATANALQAEILKDFNALNEAVENGDIRGPEARQRAADLKGQLTSFKQDYDKISSFVEQYNSMENRSAAMDQQMEKMSRFLDNTSISKNEKGRYSMFKTDPETNVTEEQSLDSLKDLLEVREKVDIAKDIAAPIFDIDSKANKAFQGTTAYNTFLESGQLTQAQKDVVQDFVSQRYDDKDLIDLADQYGVEVDITKNGVNLADKEAAIKELMPKIQESVRDQYELREYTEESQTLVLADKKLKFSSNIDYGTKKDLKYRIRKHEDGSAIINPTKNLSIASIAGIALPENTDATEAESIYDELEGPGGSGETINKHHKKFNLSVNYARISPSGRSLILNANYIPERIDANGKKVRDPETRGDVQIPIESIEAQRFLDQMGVTDQHRMSLNAARNRTSRSIYGVSNRQANDVMQGINSRLKEE